MGWLAWLRRRSFNDAALSVTHCEIDLMTGTRPMQLLSKHWWPGRMHLMSLNAMVVICSDPVRLWLPGVQPCQKRSQPPPDFQSAHNHGRADSKGRAHRRDGWWEVVSWHAGCSALTAESTGRSCGICSSAAVCAASLHAATDRHLRGAEARSQHLQPKCCLQPTACTMLVSIP